MWIALLALLAVPQEQGSGFDFTPPPGWTKTEDAKVTYLGPPGTASKQVQVAIYPAAEDASATAQSLHDRAFKMFVERAARHEEPATDRLGAFLSSRTKLTQANGEPAWLAVYTIKSGIDVGWIAFVATSADLFKEHTPAVEKVIAGARLACDPAPAAIHGLVIPWPKGWTRKEGRDGAVAFSPPPSRGPLDPTWDYTVHVMPPQPVQGTHWKTHRALVDMIVGSGLKEPTVPSMDPDGPGPFVKSSLGGLDASGKLRLFSVYSALADGKVEWMLVEGQEDIDGLRAILSRAVVKSPPKTSRPKIVEAYRRANRTTYINREGGAPILGSMVYDRIWLRDDGVADFSRGYLEGHGHARSALKLDADLLNGDVGSWKAVGRDVHVVRTRGAAVEVYVREDGRLKCGDQVWQPMPVVDGIALEGTWGLQEASITFSKGGRFQDDGVLRHASAGEGTRKPPRRGSGTFEVRDFTISFLYDDGTRWSTDFSTIGPDAVDLSSILLRHSVFAKK